MTIKEFITKAIEGGWEHPACETRWKEGFMPIVCGQPLPCNKHGTGEMYSPLLDPKAWQAVGEVEGWDEINHGLTLSSHSLPRTTYNASAGEWHYKMLEFANCLADGKSIEDFLQTL